MIILSRKGAKHNLEWLESSFGKKSFLFINDDIRNAKAVEDVIKSAEVVIHLAAQVAVTSSVTDPREDFEINALGTLNVLEAARKAGHQPIVIFASTNKVYGGMEDLKVKEDASRYQLVDFPNGIDENRNLDFHSPYGCSKGCGDQYVRDYARIYPDSVGCFQAKLYLWKTSIWRGRPGLGCLVYHRCLPG